MTEGEPVGVNTNEVENREPGIHEVEVIQEDVARFKSQILAKTGIDIDQYEEGLDRYSMNVGTHGVKKWEKEQPKLNLLLAITKMLTTAVRTQDWYRKTALRDPARAAEEKATRTSDLWRGVIEMQSSQHDDGTEGYSFDAHYKGAGVENCRISRGEIKEVLGVLGPYSASAEESEWEETPSLGGKGRFSWWNTRTPGVLIEEAQIKDSGTSRDNNPIIRIHIESQKPLR